jgi:atypical dual specificity phosphatase
MDGFYWLIDGLLAGCPRPGARGRNDAGPAELDDDLRWLKRQGIGALLSLTERPLAIGALARHGLAELHLPVNDLTAPHPDQIADALAYIDHHAAWSRAVAVHCLMGQGRTGTILAAWLIRSGQPCDAAIAHLRDICPGAIGSQSQERALEAYARHRDWIL